MRFKNKHVVITGGASGIGKRLRERFEAEGARVAIIDILPNDFFQGSVSDQATLERFAKKVIDTFETVDVLVNNAIPVMQGIDECGYAAFPTPWPLASSPRFTCRSCCGPRLPSTPRF